MVSRTDKPWGYEELLEQNDVYVVKRLFMKAGHSCSLQYHNKKHETIYVLSGKLKITSGPSRDELSDRVYSAGEYVPLKPGIVHRMTGETDALYLESSTSDLDDLVRIQDNYGRK
jgi:mannose-6-phosphate isomerase